MMNFDVPINTRPLRRRWMWFLLLVVVCSAVVSCVEEQGPVIYGRTVTEWAYIQAGLKKLPTGPGLASDGDHRMIAGDALRRAGSASAPILAGLMEARDYSWDEGFVLWSRRQSWFPGHLYTAGEKRKAGLSGLVAIGTNAAAVFPRIAAFVPGTNTVEQGYNTSEQGYYSILLHRLVSKVPNQRFNTHPSHTWVYPAPARGGARYVCAVYNAPGSVPGSLGMNIGLLNSDAQLLDYIEVDRSSRGGGLVFSKVGLDGSGEFEVRNSQRMGWVQYAIHVTTPHTNFAVSFATTQSVLRIQVVQDRFVFPPLPVAPEAKVRPLPGN